jgi:molecular chaperone GrpE
MAENENGGNGAPPEENGGGAEPEVKIEVDESIETVDQKIARLEKERQETYDRLLRIAAEFENWKKRARREAEEAETRGREKLAKEILPVLDNLDRALVAAADTSSSVESLAQGVKLVDKQLHGVLEKFDVKRFDALGEPFDPSKHEAIQQMETAEYPAGAVARVFARGYTIGARLLRPAMVAVAKALPGGSNQGATGDGAVNPDDSSAQ